jgi:hypothetical protein
MINKHPLVINLPYEVIVQFFSGWNEHTHIALAIHPDGEQLIKSVNQFRQFMKDNEESLTVLAGLEKTLQKIAEIEPEQPAYAMNDKGMEQMRFGAVIKAIIEEEKKIINTIQARNNYD